MNDNNDHAYFAEFRMTAEIEKNKATNDAKYFAKWLQAFFAFFGTML